MSDWQVGDLAVCVDEMGHRSARCRWRPISGSVYLVAAAVPFDDPDRLGLQLDEQGEQWAWPAAMFRKIRPDEQEACEPEFVTLLKRIKRKVPA